MIILNVVFVFFSHKSETGVRIEGEGREQIEVSPDCECHVCTAPPVTSPVRSIFNLYIIRSYIFLLSHI